MIFAYRPIGTWPQKETEKRKKGPFAINWDRMVYDLWRELSHLDAETPVVLQVDVRESDIRLDGLPRSQAVWYSPRVILSFESLIVGALSYPCDTYSDWKSNLRAISLTLTALRAIERYGATARHQQYTGWKALPSQTGDTLSTTDAANVIHAHSGVALEAIIADKVIAREAIRVAKARTHPDKHDGERNLWDDVEQSVSVLSSLHGVSL